MSIDWTKENEEDLQRVTSDYNALQQRKRAYERENAERLQRIVTDIARRIGADLTQELVAEDIVEVVGGYVRENRTDVALALKPYLSD